MTQNYDDVIDTAKNAVNNVREESKYGDENDDIVTQNYDDVIDTAKNAVKNLREKLNSGDENNDIDDIVTQNYDAVIDTAKQAVKQQLDIKNAVKPPDIKNVMNAIIETAKRAVENLNIRPINSKSTDFNKKRNPDASISIYDIDDMSNSKIVKKTLLTIDPNNMKTFIVEEL